MSDARHRLLFWTAMIVTYFIVILIAGRLGLYPWANLVTIPSGVFIGYKWGMAWQVRNKKAER